MEYLLSASHFPDHRERIFELYEGWLIVNPDGSRTKDPNTVCEGPLKEICVMPSHGNFHSLSNILNRAGEKILPKGVRKIKYNRLGYYIIEDNNWDELANQYGSCIPSDKYVEKWNIVNNQGKLLSNEWFDWIYPEPLSGKYIKILKDCKENLIDLDGNFLLPSNVDYVSNHFGEYFFFISEGSLIKVMNDGKKEKIKCLKQPIGDGKFYLSGKGTMNAQRVPHAMARSHCNYKIYKDGTSNFICRTAHLIFDQWYEDISFFCPGFYFLRKGNQWTLVGIDEIPLTDISFSHILHMKNDYASVVINDSCCIIDKFGNIIADGYTSFLYIYRGTWHVYYYKDGHSRHFYSGQDGGFITYAHEVMQSMDLLGLFEKENIWYYMDNDCQMHELIRYEITEMYY